MRPTGKTTKYNIVADYLKDKFEKFDIRMGERIPTEHELMKKFNVSRHTVRQSLQILENQGYISRQQGRGTFCTYSPKIKKTNNNIGIITTYISEYIFPSIIRGIDSILSNLGYNLVLYNTNNKKDLERSVLKNIINSDMSGLIIEPTSSALENTNLDLYRAIENLNIPYILINSIYEELDVPYIIMDDELGGYTLTNYAINLGHKRISGIFKKDDLQGVNRKKGFIAALKKANISNPHIGEYTTDNKFIYPYNYTKYLLDLKNPPTAIVCYNDEIAFSVIKAIKDKGLNIPKDISVLGYDDAQLSTTSSIELTTIRHPQEEMGIRAARYIVDIIEKKSEVSPYIYKPELIVRNSVMPIVNY